MSLSKAGATAGTAACGGGGSRARDHDPTDTMIRPWQRSGRDDSPDGGPREQKAWLREARRHHGAAGLARRPPR